MSLDAGVASASGALPVGAPAPGSPPRLDAAISIRGLVSVVGGHLLHDCIDLDVEHGEVMSIVGGSGSGKSVLLRTILGLQQPREGQIRVLGEDLTAISTARRRAVQGRFGVAFQEGALFSSQTVAENIQLPLREHLGLPQALMDEIAAVKLALVGLPLDAATKFPAELSGGMRKRAGLARALALDPELLFLDEPTAGLDPIAASQFDTLVRKLQSSLKITVLMVTHDIDTLRATTDRIAVLIDHKLRIGTIETLRHDPNPWIEEYFGGIRGRAALAT